MTDYKRITGMGTELIKYLSENKPPQIFFDIYNRLAELEDMIEQGTLVQLDDNLIGQEVIGIHKYTDGKYYLDVFDENIVIGFTSIGIATWNNSHGFNDWFKNGYYFPNTEEGRLEAEAKLKELKRGKGNE